MVSYWALVAVVLVKVALGSLLGGRRASEYRKILAWPLWVGSPEAGHAKRLPMRTP